MSEERAREGDTKGRRIQQKFGSSNYREKRIGFDSTGLERTMEGI